MKLRIVRHRFSGLFIIQEQVTQDGLYIVWPGYYETVESAREAIKRGW